MVKEGEVKFVDKKIKVLNMAEEEKRMKQTLVAKRRSMEEWTEDK